MPVEQFRPSRACSLAHLSMKVLRVSDCDCAVSFVWCAAFVVNFLPCVCSRDLIFSPIAMKLSQNVCLHNTSVSLKMGHVLSKARSLGQFLEKSFVCSRGQIFSLFLMKPRQNVCCDEILNKFEKWAMLSEKLVH